MIRRLTTLTALLSIGAGTLLADRATAVNDRTIWNDGWQFRLETAADTIGFADAAIDDGRWRSLTLPHDWAIEGRFSPDNPSGTAGGALPGGIGWYRKTFTTPEGLDAGRRIFVDFDGAYMNSTVFVNGRRVGTRPYGYASFSYDITPFLHPAGNNVITVRVDNAEQPNSRWYSGCGIYRNVWLRDADGVHVPLWGQHVLASDVSDRHARLTVTTDIANATDTGRDLTVITTLFDPSGKKVCSSEQSVPTSAGDTCNVTQMIDIPSPSLWSPATPLLYRLVTELKGPDNHVTGRYETVTGLRDIAFDADSGFVINGRRLKINGVCLHHDAGALGAVVNRRAIERQLSIMKEMGVNAIRVSHNPPASELLDLCDSMGLMVMDETFDMWRKKKTAHDYARYFNEWHERDLTDQVRRDRNHPSIIMWSIGNEVLEQWTDARADTLSLEQANLLLNFGQSPDMLAGLDSTLSVNSLLTRKLAGMIHALDPTRPVTAGCNEPSPRNHLFRSGAIDVIGYNYHNSWFDKVPANFPGKPFIVTESVSGLMTRGFYRMPSDSVSVCPERWDKPYHDPTFSCSSYDNCHVPWGTTHERNMADIEDKDFIAGQFVWTGFDYLGEPTPYGWPARSSYFGLVDLAGFPKDIYYMYQSRWRPDKTVLHLFPHWNWTPGQEIDLWAYYNNADEIELFVNGVSQGIRRPEKGKYHALWRVTFEPGKVEAVSRKNGKTVARQQIETAGEPAAVRLTPDRTTVKADGCDLSYITVEIVDDRGRLCPKADNCVTFSVTGPGVNDGVDNGSPFSLEPFKADNRKAFYGKALLIVRSKTSGGDITVTATSPGLTGDTAVIHSEL